MDGLSWFSLLISVLGREGIVLFTILILIFLAVAIFLVVSVIRKEQPWKGYALISLDDEKGLGAKASWISHGRELLAKGLKQTSGIFQIMTGTGPKIILPPQYVDEIKSLPQMSFTKDIEFEFFVDYPGFEPLKAGTADFKVILDMIKIKLNQSLEWHSTMIKSAVLDMVARLSSRVFLGLPLCRDAEWLEIAKGYTVAVFMAASELREVSPFLRPFLHWFKPRCMEARRQVRRAHELIDPEVEKRKRRVEDAKAKGMKPPKTADAIGWMYDLANGRRFQYTLGQLALTTAAIHTTTEVTTRAIIDICSRPELAKALREEVIQVIGDNGWSKVALYKLRLMDSFIKESQRLNPLGSLTMSRFVEKKTVLSDGTVLPKGSRFSVYPTRYTNPEVFADPETFDASRFTKLREIPGQENAHQAVALGANHLLFGEGTHACPGRFFAINEIKIALCQMLLKYDWRLIDGEEQPVEFHRSGQTMINPGLKVECRRRQEEIPL
ncbi:hypothetical protein MBLNU457_g0983t2 [Dothideomycetes sp. NU457]